MPPCSRKGIRVAEKPGTEGNVETTIAVEIDGILAVTLQSFLICNKHRYARTVFAIKENLLALVVLLLELHVGCA